MPEKKKVIIIGCGVAGISAAINLVQNGFCVEIFESKNFPGGRVYSVFDQKIGIEHDNGQHILSGAYSEFLNILKFLGTDNLIRKQKNLRVVFSYPEPERDVLDGSPFNGRFGLLWGLLKLKKIKLKSKITITKLFIKLLFNGLKSQNLNVKEFLQENCQTDEAIKKFWEPMTLATLNASIESAPAVLLIEVLNRAFFAEKETSRLIFPIVGLSGLLDPFLQWLTNNDGQIHFGESITKIMISDNKVNAIETKSGKVYFADYYISTVQPNSLQKILSNSGFDSPEFSYLKYFEFSTIISIYLWLDKELQGIDFSAMIGTNAQWLFNRSVILKKIKQPDNNILGHIALTISAGEDLVSISADELADLCFEEVKICFPELNGAKILHKKVLKDRFATVKLTSENIKLRPETETTVRNLFLAGDWTNTGLPATIESAAISGKKASMMILDKSKTA